jgi:uncharacterized protein (TIGR02246 family)
MSAIVRAVRVMLASSAWLAWYTPSVAQQSPSRLSADSSVVTRQLDEVYASFRAAYARLDPVAVAGLYADDALYLAGDSELRRGTTAIRGVFEKFFSSVRRDGAHLELRFRILHRAMAPGLATDVGYYRLVRVQGSERGRPSIGRFVTVLREGADGRWRFAIDSYTDATAAEYDQAPSHEP